MVAPPPHDDSTPAPPRRSLRVRLGPIVLDSPAVLAPLAGYSDSAMRRICRRYGAGMTFSEMLSAEGARRDNAKTLKMAAFSPDERPYFIQLFAAEPEQAAEAVKVLRVLEPDGFDLNFGCPARKIVQGSGGSALLKDVPLLARIVAATVKAAGAPVSVKMRAGWDARSLNAVEVARAVAEVGATWVTVHARTRSQQYEGNAHWEWIAEVKSSVRIPVIGNGDVRTSQDAIRLLDVTGCDAVMIGRAAIGYPFIFREVSSLIENGTAPPPATPRQRLDAARQQLNGMVEQWGERRAVLEFRKHLLAYVRGLPHSALFKTSAMKIESSKAVIEMLEQYLVSLPDVPFPRPWGVASASPVC